MNTNDECDCAIDLSLKRPTVREFPGTSLSPTKTSKKQNVPAAGTSNSEQRVDKEQNVDADASETTAVILLPKEHPYVVPQTQTEEKQITHTIETVTKQTEAMKEVIAGLPTKQSNNQSGATDKKSQEPELMASDKPTVKPARETGKKWSQIASTSQPSTLQLLTSKTSKSKASESQASTSKASKSHASTSQASKSQKTTSKATSKASSTPNSFKVRKGADSKLPTGKKASASTSVASSSSSTDSHFWLETVNSKFRSSGYKNLLRESNFTEPQAELLQNLFYQASRQMYNTFMNSDRVMKMHKCRDCEFSICHQCVSINFLHVGRTYVDATTTTVIAPNTTIICICKFAFFHAHTSRPSRSEMVNTEILKRIAHLRCAVCDTIVMIEHPQVENTDCTLSKWSGRNSSDEKAFHAQLVDHIKHFTTQTLSLEELYTCNHHCCLFFHRCTE